MLEEILGKKYRNAANRWNRGFCLMLLPEN
jgi:hypothetical protein